MGTKRSPKITITWLGHSAFKTESPTGKTLFIDPWLDNPNAPSGVKENVNADIILVTHGHSDHLGNTIEIAQRTNATVVAIYEIVCYLESKGVPSVQGMNKGGTITINGIHITMVNALHSSGIDVGSNIISGGEAAGFVITLENGFTLYHAGDTTVFGDMKLIAQLYKPDAALLPIGGFYTMGPREAALACKLLNPQYIIGMHYGTFPVLTGTPAELRKMLPSSMRKHVIELDPGKAVTL